ncbi:MAG: hypothetical protein FWD57_03095 [Polyangiaceae bacterium]|nr:hypothetical protein [Polyangiaceae bacterium]
MARRRATERRKMCHIPMGLGKTCRWVTGEGGFRVHSCDVSLEGMPA